MGIAKQTYTATATWTAAQLADIFRDAFIDAGLMTAWHDSFTDGSVQHRILRVQYDSTKAYGTTFYWFTFWTAGAVFVNVATGWNTTTKQPTGTQFLDFFSLTSSSPTTTHFGILNVNSAITIRLTRFTSEIDPTQSWFVVDAGGANRRVFAITAASASLQPWLNLDRGFYNGFVHVAPVLASNAGIINFRRGPTLRRDIVLGPAFVGETTHGNFVTSVVTNNLIAYAAVGHASAATTSNLLGASAQPIVLPVGFSSSNPAYPANSNPVFHSMPYSPYVLNPLPPDIGMTFHYATNTFSVGDRFVVSAGTEEWEVLDFAAASSAIIGPSPLFLARVV